MPFIDINGKSIYYTRNAPESYSLSIVMVHGLGSSSSFYAPIIPGLCNAGFDCIALDTCGSGLSQYSGQHQSVQTIAEDVAAVISKLSLDKTKVVLVGHSMGGIIVSELASKAQYAGVVGIGAVHPVPGLADVFGARIKKVMEDGMDPMADSIPAAATGKAAQPVHQGFIRALLLSQKPEGYASLCGVIAEAQPPKYADVKCPVLLIAGEDDKTSPLNSLKEIYERCGTKEELKGLTVLEGVGHWHVIEAAEAVEKTVVEFLQNKVIEK